MKRVEELSLLGGARDHEVRGWVACERLESLVSGEVSDGLLVGPAVKRGGVSKVVRCTRLASA